MGNLISQNTDPVGFITAPEAITNRFGTVSEGAIGRLIQLVFQTMIIGAGVYAVFNFILAGYTFMSAGNDPKKIESAWAKIYQTAIGLLFAAGAFLLAAIFGQLIFGEPTFLLQPEIPLPS